MLLAPLTKPVRLAHHRVSTCQQAPQFLDNGLLIGCRQHVETVPASILGQGGFGMFKPGGRPRPTRDGRPARFGTGDKRRRRKGMFGRYSPRSAPA